MSYAYIDTSAVLSVTFSESGWETAASRMNSLSYWISSNLLEAEVRSAFARKQLRFNPGALFDIEWVTADRPLGPEFERVLNVGYLRGADLWHVATALYMFDEPSEVTFLTLDRRQGEIAAALGFQT